MANIKSAKKRIKVIQKKTARNRRIKDHLKESIKNFEKSLESNEFESAKENLSHVEKKLMQAASKGTIHKNAASRKISRLRKKLNKAEA